MSSEVHPKSIPPNTSRPNPLDSSRKLIFISLFTLAAAIFIALFWSDVVNLSAFRRLFGSSSRAASAIAPLSVSTAATASIAAATTKSKTSPIDDSAFKMTGKTPIYFFGHGGPNIMYDYDHPAYKKLGQIGREITQKVKPDAVVVFSAHWQGGRDTIYVNNAEITELIYDFYGFPDNYYKEKYPNVGSKVVANKVLDALKNAGIDAKGTKRGLDHGVWSSFKCAFEPDENPLNVPIVQVSLFDSEDPVKHYQLGKAISHLRDQNILIIVSGMAVHNLRDLRFSFGSSRPMPYTISFDEALEKAVTTPSAERLEAMVQLMKRPDARQAHPTFDHLLPIHIGAGAAGDDIAKRLFTYPEGSMSWSQFRFGDLANASTSL